MIPQRIIAAGYQYQADSRLKRQYYHNMILMVDAIDALYFLRDPTLLRLFENAKVRKGASFTFAEYVAIAGVRTEELFNTFSLAVQRKIFLRGYRLRCNYCQYEGWYAAHRIGELVRCDGCQTPVPIPLSLDFAYRLNHLYCMGLSQGGTTTLLTLYLSWEKYQSAKSAFNYEFEVILRSADGVQTELDMVALDDQDRLVVIECKDTFADKLGTAPRTAKHTLAHTVEQARKSIEVARQLKANRFIFATLDERPIPPELTALREETGITVEIWDRARLLRG